MTQPTAAETQAYKVYIKASADDIFKAVTDPEWTNRYGYTGYTNYDLQPGGAHSTTPNEEFKKGAEEFGFPCPDVLVSGEVLEVDAPHLLKVSWHFHMDPEIEAEGPSTLTYEIKEAADGYCSLTLVHEMPTHPKTATMVAGTAEHEAEGGGGGWSWVLSDLKTLLETGTAMTAAA